MIATTMSNSEGLRCRRRRHSNRHYHTSSMLAAVLLALLSNFAVLVNSQADLVSYCGIKPCIEALRMSCEELIESYQFQGSCCSMESIPQTGGCRVTVSFGNCFWYPWCGVCDKDDNKASRCNNIFETDANQRPCPVADFDPVEIQQSENFTIPSCSPSMSPSDYSMLEDGEDSSAVSSISLVSTTAVMTGAAAVLVAVIAAAVFAV